MSLKVNNSQQYINLKMLGVFGFISTIKIYMYESIIIFIFYKLKI